LLFAVWALILGTCSAGKICAADTDCTDLDGEASWFGLPPLDKHAKVVFIDYDLTLTSGDFSETARNTLCGGPVTKPDFSCPCFNATGAGSCGPSMPQALVNSVQSTSNYEYLITQNFGPLNAYEGNTTDKVGSYRYAPARITNLANALSKLRGNGMMVYILSTSWYPVTADQWKNYVLMTMEVANLGFDADHIISLPVAVPGQGADKGKAIQAKLAELKMTKEQCLFTDDSSGNIKSAQGICNTLWLTQRRGLEEADLFYMMQPIMHESSSGGDDDSGLSAGTVVGIAVGSFLVGGLVAAAVAVLFLRSGKATSPSLQSAGAYHAYDN